MSEANAVSPSTNQHLEDVSAVYLMALEQFLQTYPNNAIVEGIVNVRYLIEQKRHYEAADLVIRAVRLAHQQGQQSMTKSQMPGVAFDYCGAVYPERESELIDLFFHAGNQSF